MAQTSKRQRGTRCNIRVPIKVLLLCHIQGRFNLVQCTISEPEFVASQYVYVSLFLVMVTGDIHRLSHCVCQYLSLASVNVSINNNFSARGPAAFKSKEVSWYIDKYKCDHWGEKHWQVGDTHQNCTEIFQWPHITFAWRIFWNFFLALCPVCATGSTGLNPPTIATRSKKLKHTNERLCLHPHNRSSVDFYDDNNHHVLCDQTWK